MIVPVFHTSPLMLPLIIAFFSCKAICGKISKCGKTYSPNSHYFPDGRTKLIYQEEFDTVHWSNHVSEQGITPDARFYAILYNDHVNKNEKIVANTMEELKIKVKGRCTDYVKEFMTHPLHPNIMKDLEDALRRSS